MQDYYRDTWNDADQQVMHYNEAQLLEGLIEDLEQQVKELQEDEIFILAEIMFLRDHYSDYRDMHEELTELIKLHGESVRQKAKEMLLKQYPNRHWGDFV